MSKLKPFTSIISSFVAAIGYGIFARLAFGSEQFSPLFGTISIGFLFLVPVGLGALTVYFAPAQYRTSWPYALSAPWLACSIFAALAAIFSWEAWICVVMALPIFLVMASTGGLIMFWIIQANKPDKSQTGLMGLLLLAPFLLTPLEHQLPVQDSLRVVHTQIEINAGPVTVWQNITRVPKISETEHHFSFFHLAGLPRPSSATLSHDGVGGVRHGQWEDGLAFTETITEWQLYESYVMDMAAEANKTTF